jgi:hypothetical protein
MAPTIPQARLYGALFASSSVVTPFLFGTVAGAVAAGRVPLDGSGDRWTAWTGATSLIGGALAVLTCAFLAAVFLTAEAARGADLDLLEACRRRALGGAFWLARRRGRDLLRSRRFLQLAVLAGPAAVAALELGWITTEVGRQPWVVYRLMRIDEAVTRGSGVWLSLAALIVVYTAMTAGAVVTLRSMARRWRAGESLELPTPYSPTARRRRSRIRRGQP